MNPCTMRTRRNFRDFSPRAAVQAFFLTTVFFIENNLTSHAAACAFGFLFSFIPIFMIIAAILVQLLHASADSIAVIFGANGIIPTAIPMNEILDRIASIRVSGHFEIAIAVFTVWLSRNFFNAVSVSLRKIYKKRLTSRPVVNQFVVFAEEMVVILAIAALIFFSTTARTLFSLSLPSEIKALFADIASPLSAIFGNPFSHFLWLAKPAAQITMILVPYICVFVFIAVMYKAFASGSGPSLRLSVFSAGLCTVVFFAVQKLMSAFININRYDLVYGVFSRLIVMLLGVYVFFVLFLFFAQFMFVLQFFDDLLLGELYLLQERNLTAFFARIRYKIFVLPDYFLRPKKHLETCTFLPGEKIYSAGDFADSAFYIASGRVEIFGENEKSELAKGSFFGEMSCVLKKRRDNTVIASEKTIVVKISAAGFSELIHKNSEVSRKVLEQIGVYFAKIYGESAL